MIEPKDTSDQKEPHDRREGGNPKFSRKAEGLRETFFLVLMQKKKSKVVD